MKGNRKKKAKKKNDFTNAGNQLVKTKKMKIEET